MQSARASLRPATRAAYRSSLDTHLLPARGKRRLDHIDVDAVASLVERMQTIEYRKAVEQGIAAQRSEREGKRITARAVSIGYKTWTIAAFSCPPGASSSSHGVGSVGPGPTPCASWRARAAEAREQGRRILSRVELTQVIAAADEPYRVIIATAAGLGTRLGETLGLRWRDIDLDNGAATIRFQIDRHGNRVE